MRLQGTCKRDMRVPRTGPCVPQELGTLQRIMVVLEDIKGVWASRANQPQCLVSSHHRSPRNVGSMEKEPGARGTARSPASTAKH